MTDSSDPDRTDSEFDDPTAPAWTGPDAGSPAEPSLPSDATQPVGTGERTQPIPAATAPAPPAPATPPAEPPVEPFGNTPFSKNPTPRRPTRSSRHPRPRTGTRPYGQTGYDQAPFGQAPYGQLEPAQTPYGQQPYGSTAYGQPPYALPPGPYGPPPKNGNALALTIVSAIGTVLCCLLCLPSLILGIVALSKQSTDPQGSARLARWGSYALAGAAVIAVISHGGLHRPRRRRARSTAAPTSYQGAERRPVPPRGRRRRHRKHPSRHPASLTGTGAH